MKVELINGKLYQEVDRKDIQSKLDQLEQQKASIDYDALNGTTGATTSIGLHSATAAGEININWTT